MLEKTRGELTKPIMGDDFMGFKNAVKELSPENRKKSIKELSKQYGMHSATIIQEINECLISEGGYQSLQSGLDKDASKYKEYYQKTQNNMFQDTHELFIDISKYVVKAVEQQKVITQKKLIRLLITYPGIEEQRAVVAKAYDIPLSPAKDIAVNIQEIEAKKEGKRKTLKENPSEIFIKRLHEILAIDISDEQKIQQIEKSFYSIFGLQRMMWQRLYKTLGLADEYLKYIKSIDIQIIKLLLQNKEAPNPSNILAIERSIKTYIASHDDDSVQGKKSTGVTVVGKMELPIKKAIKQREIRQAPTFDDLNLVGKKMGKTNFLAAFSLDYEEIKTYIETGMSIPARYSNSSKIEKGTLCFFTIGQDKRGNETPSINVCIKDGGKHFESGEVVEVILTAMDDNINPDSKRQTYNIRGIFVEDAPQTNPATHTLEDNLELRKLKERLQENGK